MTRAVFTHLYFCHNASQVVHDLKKLINTDIGDSRCFINL